MRKDPATGLGNAMRTVVVVLGIVLVNVTTARAYTWEAVCDVGADYALGLENYPETIRLHQEVLTTHPGNALAHYHLGFAYGMSGRKTDEISEYLAAAKLGLDKWDLFLNLGLAYLGRNDRPNAIKALQTAVLLGPEHPEAHYNLAIAYEEGNRLREALQEVIVSLRLA